MEVMPEPEEQEGGDVAYICVKGVMGASGALMLVVLDVMVLPLPVDVAAAAGAWAGGRSLPGGGGRRCIHSHELVIRRCERGWSLLGSPLCGQDGVCSSRGLSGQVAAGGELGKESHL